MGNNVSLSVYLSVCLMVVCIFECIQECVEQRKKFIHYIKIHVPWETLSVYAEYLLLRAPLQVCDFNRYRPSYHDDIE